MEELKGKLNKVSDEFAAFKKDQENSPISIVRVKLIPSYFLFKTLKQNELSEKNREIKDLKKEIEKVNQVKEEYKDYYEKMRNGSFL